MYIVQYNIVSHILLYRKVIGIKRRLRQNIWPICDVAIYNVIYYIGLLYRYIVHCTLQTPLAPVVYRHSSGVVVAVHGLNERSSPLDSCDGVITFRIIGLEDERGRLGLRKKVCAVAAAEHCSSPRSCDCISE